MAGVTGGSDDERSYFNFWLYETSIFEKIGNILSLGAVGGLGYFIFLCVKDVL